jgi:hypothetical protein
MTIADYFKVSFKKPELSETISQIIEKKAKLKNQLESCYSRLESIEICNSNSKSADAIILSNYLIVDIANLALSFQNQANITITDNWLEKVKNISDEEIKSAFSNHNSILTSTYETEEEKSEKIETSLSELLYSVEKFIFKKNKTQFENPVDDFKKKSTIQVIVSIIVLAFALNAGIKQYNKIKPIKPDVAKLYFMNEQNTTPVASNLVTADVSPSEEWKEARFSLPNPSEVKDIKVELVHQVHARFQLKELKYFDANGKVVRERNFKLNNLGMVENTETNEICCTEDLKPGKLQPEKYMELESVNANPSFYVKMEETKAVKEIFLTYRYIKNTKKFTD